MSRIFLSTMAVIVAISFVSAPAFGQFYVSKSQRELLVFSNLTPSDPQLTTFYNFVEFSAQSLAAVTLGSGYNRIWMVNGAGATRSNLRAWLNYLGSRSNVRAVDMIFVTHGLSDGMKFAEGTYTASDVATYLRNTIPSSRRAKLRMCFSTACFGASHRQAWRDVGFKAVSGSREVYADSALSYQPFLTGWRTYNTFRNSVNFANAADPGRVQDSIASSLLWMAGSSAWDEVDSFRIRQGYTSSIRLHRQL